MRSLLFAALAAGLLSSTAQAAVLFDFEGTATSSGGTYTSLTQSMDGLTVTFTRPGSSFDIRDLSGLAGPPSFGTRTLDPFHDTGNTSFVADFSKALTGLSFQAGDYGQDSDTIQVSLYSGLGGTGTLVGTTTYDYGSGSFPNDVATLSFSGSPFQSAVFIGGSTDYPNSVYYDNFSATVSGVPLPASAPLFGAALLGLAAIGYCSKRRKASASA